MADSAQETICVIGVDASEQAEYAVKYYLTYLHRPEYKIVFVHAIELPPMKDAKQEYMTPGKLQDLWDKEKEKGAEIETKIKAIMESKGISDYKLETISGGKAGHGIVQKATEHNARMIVVGTRGMGTIRRTIMGSVSEYVVHHSHCPVIVCRK